MNFEWDANKANINIAKHGVYFEDAVGIFLDKNSVTSIDKRTDYREERIRMLGVVKGSVLVVVYTIRNGHYRIISARRANSREKRKYRETNT